METGKYRIIEHTADIGIEIETRSLAGVFIHSADALKNIIFGKVRLEENLKREIELEEKDTEILLVTFLNELLYLLEVERFAFSRMEISEIDGKKLKVILYGSLFDPSRTKAEREIKSATYHQINVSVTDEGTWKGRIFFDL